MNKKLEERMTNQCKKLRDDLMFIIPSFTEIERMTIVSIGTPKVNYDAVGPLVGSYLKILIDENEELKDFVDIVGTVDDPANALTVVDKTNYLFESEYLDNFILAIDASVTSEESILFTPHVRNEGVKPGRGLGRKIREIGEASLVCPTLLIDKDASTSNILEDRWRYCSSYTDVIYLAKNITEILFDVLKEKLNMYFKDIEEELK